MRSSSDQAVTLTTVTPPLALTIKTLELDSGLLRCVRTDQEDSAWGSSYYGEAMSGAGGSLSQSYVDLQPDGNSFDLMTGMIKQKV
jgi:biotin--protein ligase